ncbi:hypothetical protein [Vreelandella alkaliphila]|uniref:Poly-beta-hydroxybutyrate polymerase N-terminal domain-containing protein n=1 Tax=Vreelandella alkaliphila TaxID=272774 RepID=A0AAJ2VPR8_9GAMM|nr:hypothetical protein [Halomonas alkaliphila]MDX5976290.1 hypothetical protein [Halomonas alkaliphila]
MATLPYNLLYQSFLLQQQWWYNATIGLRGLSPHHEQAVEFGARQWLDVLSPSNYLLTNPVVIRKTLNNGGANLLYGIQHWWEDIQNHTLGKKPEGSENFVVGRDLAVTPGKVVYLNHLIELIQYSPATDKVHSMPLLIVPAWFMVACVASMASMASMAS